MTPFEMVREFHDRAGLPAPDVFEWDDTQVPLRLALHAEEFAELQKALSRRDPVEIAQELADLVYVVVGTAVTFGIDFDAVFEEVHRANMSKIEGGVERRADGKVLKGPNYRPPDISRALLGL